MIIVNRVMNKLRALITVSAFSAFLFSGCASQAGYLAKQGGYLLKFSTGAVPIDRVIQDQATSSDTRDFLHRVENVKRFAVDRIGLKDNGNFTRYKMIDRDYLADVVQACDALSFSPYLWTYPFLGKLPYMGFYERPDAEAEAARVRKLGYDAIVRTVDDFSTLGLLKDPVYSFMVKYTPYEIADLVIHEQTHATLFLKGQPDFNEEFATFVGDTGALEWLAESYGTGSAEYRSAVDSRADYDTFLSILAGVKGELRAVYDSSLSREEKLARKAAVIATFKEGWAKNEAPRFRSADYRRIADIPINNAYLSLYDLYSGDIPLLRDYYERRCGSDLRRFVGAVKLLAGKGGDVKARMKSELETSDR
jgi:predicted aminopeptidase